MGLAITNDDLIAWINEQPCWLKDAIVTFYENGEFSDKDIKRFAKECLDEVNGVTKAVDTSSLNILTRDDRNSFTITAIRDVKGVNALADGKSLTFGGAGITVVYGENGAGKSGYIRILKKLADAKYKEELKRNVYSSKRDKQSCEVEVFSEGKTINLICDLSKDGEHILLKDMDVFDTRISKAYVEAAKEASYEPWLFSMFSALATATTLVKSELEEKKKSLNTSEIMFPDELCATDVAKKLLAIDAKSKIDDAIFTWSETDEFLLSKKEKESNVDALIASIKQHERELKQITSLKSYLESFVEFFSKNNVKIISEKKEKLAKAIDELEAAKLLFEKDATEVDKKSISNSAWLSLWQNAKKYYDTVLSKEGYAKYTEKNGLCPLCGSLLADENHVHRARSIEEYVNGNASEKVNADKNAYYTALKKCPKAWEESQIELAVSACGFEQGFAERIKIIAALIAEVSIKIYGTGIDSLIVSEIKVEEVVTEIANIYMQKETAIKAYKDLLQDEDHKSIINEINELRARKKASSLIDTVKNRIQYLQDVQVIDRAEKLTSSNKLTAKSKQLAEELLTEDYINRFNNELKILTRGTVKATLKQQKATKGKIPFKVELEGLDDHSVNPIDVLSEGENRVVSLAAFFAESSGRQVECPLIVDDPISSLDYKYEAAVINRLVEAGKHRQVIVFTHRLSMVVGLSDACKKSEVAYTEKELRGNNKFKGIPCESVNGGKTLSKLKDIKNTNVARIKKIDSCSDEYIEGVHYICQQIRIHVEKCVEDTLINDVVKRYRKDVQTQGRIMWLANITSDDCKIIDEMMTKYSYYDHSMSDEAPLVEFSIEEIEMDLEKMIRWLTDVEQRKKKI